MAAFPFGCSIESVVGLLACGYSLELGVVPFFGVRPGEVTSEDSVLVFVTTMCLWASIIDWATSGTLRILLDVADHTSLIKRFSCGIGLAALGVGRALGDCFST